MFIGNPKNKPHMVKFLSELWCDIGRNFTCPDQKTVITDGFKDSLIACMVISDEVIDQEDLFLLHKDADTWLLCHVAYASQECLCVVVCYFQTLSFLCIHFIHKLETS